MGSIYGRSGSYGLGLALLALVALVTLGFTATVVRRPPGSAAAPLAAA
jgi:NNP family nitrate/nitrite transporter-like MFS transporter